MKILAYKSNISRRRRSSSFDIDLEKILFFIFLVLFSIIMVVQVALFNPSSDSILASNTKYEGEPLQKEEYLYEKGEIKLELVSGRTDGKTLVLVNGKEADAFTDKSITLEVKNGDIIEIDGRNAVMASEVKISWCSSNITYDIENTHISVGKNIKKITKVRINK